MQKIPIPFSMIYKEREYIKLFHYFYTIIQYILCTCTRHKKKIGLKKSTYVLNKLDHDKI